MSDDGAHGLTLIAFVGSVFSPWYARALRRDPAADPAAHCALNVSLHGRPRRWTMTERHASAVRREPGRFAIGPSDVAVEDDGLVFRIRERGCPLPLGVRGTVRVRPETPTRARFALDPAGLHRWSPVSPRAAVEVSLDAPRLRWRGTGYLDANDGDEPLAHAFRRWHWCRAPLPDGRTAIVYDRVLRDGTVAELGLAVGADGVEPLSLPAVVPLPPTRWRVGRETRAEHPGGARVVETLQDSPFYARSLLRASLGGAEVVAMHESLDLRRFAAPVVQAMLPFRVPRRG